MRVLNFDEPMHLFPELGFYLGSLEEFMGWKFIELVTFNHSPWAEASGEASGAGVEGMSLGGRGAT